MTIRQVEFFAGDYPKEQMDAWLKENAHLGPFEFHLTSVSDQHGCHLAIMIIYHQEGVK